MENHNPDNQLNNHKESLVRQGENTSEVFAGKYKFEATKELYGESAHTVAQVIQNLIPLTQDVNSKYEFADLGSFKGELLNSVLAELPNYNFHTTAVDINETALRENNADQKIIATLDRLPIKESSQDVVLARYILAWNNPEEQKDILKEISRITKGVAIVQHAGADSEVSDEWRTSLNNLLDGQAVPKLKREGHFFSSRNEIEKWLEDNNIKFKRLIERKVDNFSDVFTERFNLNEEEIKTMKGVLGDKNYIIQTTWLIFPKNLKDEN